MVGVYVHSQGRPLAHALHGNARVCHELAESLHTELRSTPAGSDGHSRHHVIAMVMRYRHSESVVGRSNERPKLPPKAKAKQTNQLTYAAMTSVDTASSTVL